MKSPAIIHKFFPFILLSMVLGVVFITNMEAEASSMVPDADGFNASSQISPLPTSAPTNEPTPVPTPIPTDEPTLEPTDIPSSPTPIHTPPVEAATLSLEGPSSTTINETFRVNVLAQNLPDPGLYGVQFEINYDSSRVSISNLQSNPNLSFVVRDNVDNTAGMVSFAASQQGRVSGLTGDVVLLSFDVTATDSGPVTFIFEDVKFSDSEARSFDVTSQDHTITIEQGSATPVPTEEPTEEPTPAPTIEPTTQPTSVPTVQPTKPPVEPTSEPTVEPTAQPTTEPTVQPTTEPTAEPTDQPTPQPAMADVSGQIVLAGRAGNNWSGATAMVDSGEQTTATETAVTDVNGNFDILNVAAGLKAVTADAPGYLSAVCANVTIAAPQTSLSPATLLGGDINSDDLIDIVDAATAGTNFGQTGSNPADITLDEIVDIFDIVLVSVNYGEAGPQIWDCSGPNSSPIQ